MPLKIKQHSPSPSDLAARARELAAHAEALASAITTLHHDIRAAREEPVRRAGFRCDTATGWARAGRVVNVHALLAAGVNADGHREILGLQVTSAEDGAGWLAFFRGPDRPRPGRRPARHLRRPPRPGRGHRRDAARRLMAAVPHSLRSEPRWGTGWVRWCTAARMGWSTGIRLRAAGLLSTEGAASACGRAGT
jgi:hypothetical protein